MTIDEQVGRRIAKIARARGVDQLELAELLGCSLSSISKKVAASGSRFRLDELERLAKLFDVSIEHLITGNKVEVVGTFGISKDAMEVATAFDKLNNDNRYAISMTIMGLLRNQQQEE